MSSKNSLRPNTFDNIVGQESAMEVLKIACNSAKLRSDCVGHTLLYGPAGTGKTTIAKAIANHMGSDTKMVLASNVNNVKDILSTILNIQEGDVLFIDEIHRLNKRLSECIYTVLEDFRIDVPVAKNKEESEIISFDLPKFTVVGATTDAGNISKPLLDRFKIKLKLNLYSAGDLANIIEVNSKKLKMSMDSPAILGLAKASRGTPRIANSLLEWIRDYSVSKGESNINRTVVTSALNLQGIDEDGTTDQDRIYLSFLKKMKGQPVGVNTISSATNLDKATIENIIEPFLLQKQLMARTTRGRIAL
jgi:Holliday junction DNA helicase RuvB